MSIYVKVKLPFCLYLRDGLYRLVVPDVGTTDPVLVYLSKFRRDKAKIDYFTFWRAELVEKGELWNDRNGTFRRTAATVILPTSAIDVEVDYEKKSFHDQFPSIMEVVLRTLNRLIVIYRYATGDTYIPNINHDDINNTFEIGNCTVSPDGSFQSNGFHGGFDNRLTNTMPDYDDAIHDELNRWLSNGNAVPLFEDFLMSARFQLQEGNWRVAVIEAQTGFEVFVSETVRLSYLGKGEDASAVERKLKCGLENLITKHLPKVTGKTFTSGEKNYDKWYSQTYMMRNRIVHGGYTPTMQEALDGVLGVEYALEYLSGRPKNKYWIRKRPVTQVNEFLTGL